MSAVMLPKLGITANSSSHKQISDKVKCTNIVRYGDEKLFKKMFQQLYAQIISDNST